VITNYTIEPRQKKTEFNKPLQMNYANEPLKNAAQNFFEYLAKVRRPGIEPGSTAWRATMLTFTPATPSCLMLGGMVPSDEIENSLAAWDLCCVITKNRNNSGIMLLLKEER
jgi:hypothetical protein